MKSNGLNILWLTMSWPWKTKWTEHVHSLPCHRTTFLLTFIHVYFVLYLAVKEILSVHSIGQNTGNYLNLLILTAETFNQQVFCYLNKSLNKRVTSRGGEELYNSQINKTYILPSPVKDHLRRHFCSFDKLVLYVRNN